MAAQDQALRTNAYGTKIERTSMDSKCHLCKDADEMVGHLASYCKKIVQTNYKERHNSVATLIHWNMCKKYKLPSSNNW